MQTGRLRMGKLKNGLHVFCTFRSISKLMARNAGQSWLMIASMLEDI
jgi:hypothetical protein